MRTDEDLSETLAEEFVASATAGEPVDEDVRDEVYEEEQGGPFVISSAGRELADTEDEMNDEDTPAEPFPTALRGS